MKFKKLFLISIFVFVLLMANTVMTFAATYEWSLASVLPESHPVHSSLEFFAKRVN
ncbi:hypothetical protein C8C77_11410 [Halanaerobium saccharolyticum]|uniref:Uncharacterized protein n=1 Tax=Halanaerobium saccharolyticum TaxID=43595 RepID=A0A4R7YXV2_9FIRM|nr:hypothetical protein [Halanaerobium saccharolyticum]RAK12708.1 hypothetical protein C7958_101270 [Halanaerobium saccharolyticum]TDW02921.1 hypothetical protein C8C77_11410 [Halanaerobium saccharolyticum]TDX62895.1 hypothetical protein C7956_10362 [Halanaerobium saccharolyticum]